MNLIERGNNINIVREKWQYKPEFSTADTSSYVTLTNTITTNTSGSYIAYESDRRIKQMYKEREEKMSEIKLDELKRDLKQMGIELTAIRCSSGYRGCEVEGYFYPEEYDKYVCENKPKVKINPTKPIPKKVIFSGPATTILWKDGTKTTVKCSNKDVWDYDVGVAMCYLKKMLGNKGNYNNIFREAEKVSEDKE